jgi:hypothetical protein
MFETILALGIVPMWFILLQLYRKIERFGGRFTIGEIGFWFCVSLFWPLSVPFMVINVISDPYGN